ncbi:hypothetical protein J1614_009177 [Plenodomus biglobosus]|nr:hypothetical protein J1614_009177 [Plenodomus biglobosus]
MSSKTSRGRSGNGGDSTDDGVWHSRVTSLPSVLAMALAVPLAVPLGSGGEDMVSLLMKLVRVSFLVWKQLHGRRSAAAAAAAAEIVVVGERKLKRGNLQFVLLHGEAGISN